MLKHKQPVQKKRKFTGLNRFPEYPRGPREPYIPTKPFDGIGEINPIKLSDYAFTRTIRRVIGTSEDLEKAVYTVMINMFLDLPGSVIRPGKEYSGRERQYIRRQLGIFQRDLSVQEVIFGPDESTIGRFQNKKRYRITGLGEFLDSDLLDGNDNCYHIVRIANPSYIVSKVPDGDNSGVLPNILTWIYGFKLADLHEELHQLFSRYREELEYMGGSKELNDFLIAQGIDEDTDRETGLRAFKEYLKSPHIPDAEKEILAKVLEIAELPTPEEEISIRSSISSEIRKKIGNEEDIITRIAGNTPILILEPSGIRDVPGYRLVGDYQNHSLHQIVNSS